MMFPRRQAVARVATGALLTCVLGWMVISSNTSNGDLLLREKEVPNSKTPQAPTSPLPIEGQPNVPAKLEPHNSPDETRAHTAKNSSEEQTHHHSNQTLEKMANNMTLHHVNKSEIRDIMLKMNETHETHVNHNHEPCPNNKCVNPHPFHYNLITKSVCKNKNIFLISYIHTAPSHYKRRMIIRETWGNAKYYSDVTVRVVFVMGRTFDKPEVQSALEFESEQYGDIVQEDFLDSYKNLTYKGIGALKWITNYCSHAKFVLKADDDIFVNTFTLLRHLKSLHETGVDNQKLILCLVWNRMLVMRSGKWKVIGNHHPPISKPFQGDIHVISE